MEDVSQPPSRPIPNLKRGYPLLPVSVIEDTTEGKTFVAKNGSFLEKEFLSKGVSGRKVELDEVIDPSPELASSAAQEDVPEQPSPPEEGANDGDHAAPVKAAIEPRRSTRERTAPNWYNPVMNVMLLDNDEPAYSEYKVCTLFVI